MSKHASLNTPGNSTSQAGKQLFESKIMETQKSGLDIVKRLYAMQLSGNGISAETYSSLPAGQQSLLEKKNGSYCL